VAVGHCMGCLHIFVGGFIRGRYVVVGHCMGCLHMNAVGVLL
jgi:hypothetical protein